MIAVIKNSKVLYLQETETVIEGLRIINTLFGITPANVKEPLAMKIDQVAYVISFRETLPSYLHIQEDFRDADVLILDSFELYGEKVKQYYLTFTKDQLMQELLQYRIRGVADGNVSTII